jgi:hypothetical protein
MDLRTVELEIIMPSRLLRTVYPLIVGILLGVLQTGLFFQLSFTLSSSFGTFLMITLAWLVGSAIGLLVSSRISFDSGIFVVLSLVAYFICGVLVRAAPFNTHLWPLYAVLIMLTGLYPGVFFARMGQIYTARQLFFTENNGFILGLVSGTLLFLLLGRIVLWVLPFILTAVVLAIREPVPARLLDAMKSDDFQLNLLAEDKPL